MRATIVMCVGLAGCGSKTEPAAKPVERFAKVKQPKVSPVCEQARRQFGYGAECIEQELPALASPAGKVTRVMQKGDATAAWTYVATRPDGSYVLGSGGGGGPSQIVGELLANVDARTLAPELLARLNAALDTESAIVRCLPGSNDALPEKDGKPLPCAPPAVTKTGDKVVLTYVIEQFPHPRRNRTNHWLYAEKVEVKEHGLSSIEGSGLVELPADAPLPKDAPPLPTMTTPPAWVAAPVAAPAEVSTALCASASEKVAGIKGRACKAYAYPSLDSPVGQLFYLANDAGLRQVLGLKKPDGTIVTGYDVETGENPMIAIVKTFDPKVIPAEKIVALHLFLQGEAVHVLCLPGSNDAIPDNKCEAPKAERKGDAVVLTYTVEELPFPNKHGSVPDPAVRSYSTELSPGGGSDGGGFRLIDMRDN